MTSGSEPRHAAHETVEERLAEEVVEELDLHRSPRIIEQDSVKRRVRRRTTRRNRSRR